MAAGDTHTLENDSMRVILTEHATYGVVLTSIENLIDGAYQEFVEQSLYRVILRKVQIADEYFTLTGDTATTVNVHGLEEYEGGGGPGNLLIGESPARGARKFFHADFHYLNVNSTSDDLTIHIYVNLIENEPERVLFSIIFDQTQTTGSQTMSQHAFFWAAPVLLAMEPHASDHYIIGTNCGTVTRDPVNDLAGNGTDYQFHVGTDTSSVTATLDAATGFEPETQSRYADRMEVMYPTWMAIALSGYGNRATSGATVYVHDELRFRPRRVRDWFDGTNILLEHECLIENGITGANGWVDVIQYRADSYVAVFKRVGDVLGEEIGLHYRKWAHSSPNGQAIIPAKSKDRDDNGALIHRSPIFRPYFTDDDDYDNGITEQIALEFRMAFPALEDLDEHPLYRVNYDLVYEYNNDASGTLPGNVGNTSADLFAISADVAKSDYSQELYDEYGLWTYAGIVPRRPTPFDGRGYFLADDMSGARCKNHHEAVAASYPSVQDYLHYSKTVASVSFSGGFTRVVLSAGAFDPDLWAIFSSHTTTTGGINHAAHPSHLGWFQKTDVSYAFPIEKQSAAEAAFKADPPTIWVAGDRTATITAGHALDIHFSQAQYLPGYDIGGTNLRVGTSLCGMDDEIGNEGATAGGWATRFIADYIAQCRPWMQGVLFVLTRIDQICFGDHGNHKPGSNEQLLAWRRILAELRAAVLADDATPFQIWDEDGPYDWLLGLVDGHTRTNIRLDICSLVRQWGASPLFQTVWGDYYRFGGQLADRNGHITNFNGPTTYDVEFVGSGSRKWREAMVGDFMLGRLPSFGVYPAADGALGTRPDGQPAYTPFYHTTEGMTVSASYAAMLARLAQMQLAFDSVNVLGRRVRSLTRTSTRVVPHVPVETGFGHGQVYNIGIDETGPNRAPIQHNVMRDHRNPRRLVATFVNPDITATGTSYVIDPELYADQVPLITQGYKLKLYRCNYDGVELEREWMARGSHRFALHLEAGEVVVLTIEFSELQFIYRYDDEDFVELDMATDQLRQRIEPLGGQGARFQFGFKSDHSESDFRIASAHLRAFLMGRSENV
jgi:hypothetical protein